MTAALLTLAAVALTVQLARVLGRGPGLAAGGLAAVALAGGWWLLAAAGPIDQTPADWTAVGSVPSETCARCHPDHHASWHRTYHRTMTQEATPAAVRGDFNNAIHDYQGLTTRFVREGDTFTMQTVRPDWAAALARAGGDATKLPPPMYTRFKVDRLVGSHWLQECLHKEPSGRYVRLPVLYHIAEGRWVHTNGAFLAPDTDDFWDKSRAASWNDTCLYCHNTGPSKNPVRGFGGRVEGYKTAVAELGISCEACHGPAADHVAANGNPARRFAVRAAGRGDPTIVHPERLTVERRDEVCARCHGALVPKPAAWDARTHKDPFVAGQELARFSSLFRSEDEQAVLAGVPGAHHTPGKPGPIDGRFWGDGTPLTTALEYNAMALSACYQNGHGSMSCLSCHAGHPDDPDMMLKPGMRTNEACLQCHGEYRGREAEHSRHPAGSAGDQCVNCHMPHQVYSLLTTHRSHRITVPDVASSVGTGKPNACALCHLDKSLGWVQDRLRERPHGAKHAGPELSKDEREVSSAVLLLSRADARTRVVVAGAFADPDARRASGTDWMGPVLTRLMADDRYPAVRYLAYRGLGPGAGPYDDTARPAARAAQLRPIRERFDLAPVRRPLPYLPFTADGRVDEAKLAELRKGRTDPDLTVNE